MNKSTPAVNGASPLEQTAIVIRGDEHTVLSPQRVAGKGDLVDGAAAAAANSHPRLPHIPQRPFRRLFASEEFQSDRPAAPDVLRLLQYDPRPVRAAPYTDPLP